VMRPPATFVTALSLFLIASAGVRAQSGFDRAIDTTLQRVVKLYGLKVGQQVGYGTGTIVSAEGHVLTVYSLLLESKKLRAVTSDGHRYHAKLVNFDRETQLALIKMTKSMDGDGAGAVGSFPFFDLACTNSREVDSSLPKCDAGLLPGDWVIAAGNPFKVAKGAEPASVAHGVYSTRTRLDARRKVNEFPYHGDVLVVDAVTSNPGAPGGPLVTLDGELVGMIGRLVVSNLTHTRINYAMPRDVLYDFFKKVIASPEEIASGNASESAHHGSSTDPFAKVDPGIRLTRTGYMRLPPFVERVRRGSLAKKAGVRKDDLILSINGHSVPDLDSYDKRMERLNPKEPVDLVIQRKRRVITIRIEPVAKHETETTKP